MLNNSFDLFYEQNTPQLKGDEVENFMCIQQPPIGMDVYKWWATYRYQYPALKQLTSDTFVAMGSSVPADSAFSESGQLLTP